MLFYCNQEKQEEITCVPEGLRAILNTDYENFVKPIAQNILVVVIE